MKRLLVAAAAVLTLASAGAASAQPYGGPGHGPDRHDNNGGPRHDWRQGGRIAQSDWRRGQRVDYRRHHLRAPPRGYEWRQVDGNYVLAAAATGLIASILASNGR